MWRDTITQGHIPGFMVKRTRLLPKSKAKFEGILDTLREEFGVSAEIRTDRNRARVWVNLTTGQPVQLVFPEIPVEKKNKIINGYRGKRDSVKQAMKEIEIRKEYLKQKEEEKRRLKEIEVFNLDDFDGI